MEAVIEVTETVSIKREPVFCANVEPREIICVTLSSDEEDEGEDDDEEDEEHVTKEELLVKMKELKKRLKEKRKPVQSLMSASKRMKVEPGLESSDGQK